MEVYKNPENGSTFDASADDVDALKGILTRMAERVSTRGWLENSQMACVVKRNGKQTGFVIARFDYALLPYPPEKAK